MPTPTDTLSPIIAIQPLGFPWATVDPFLFCAYHDDAYPPANGQFGPAASLAGRPLGQDFSRQDGWSMYHGEAVPGFPGHPHRGFETVTIVRKGLVDHADSLGATARYGQGDVQWLTAGKGIQHAEMFPLLDTAAPNPLELFQIWLNLPARRKMAEPHFTMFWATDIPRLHATDAQGRSADVSVVAGALPVPQGQAVAPLAPPPDSWAAEADADVAIWTLRLDAGAQWILPPATGQDTRRSLYFFKGQGITVGGQSLHDHAVIELRTGVPVLLEGGPDETELLMLQGRPIAEPVVQYGPFVMNTQAEIMQTMHDYRRTQFGGWPWRDAAPVHGATKQRFALRPGGQREEPTA